MNETQFQNHLLFDKIEQLSVICRQIIAKPTLSEKESVLEESFAQFYHKHFNIAFMINHLPQKPRYLLKSLIAAGQAHILIDDHKEPLHEKDLLMLSLDLEPCESFYADLGGLLGYQHHVLSLMVNQGVAIDKVSYFPPESVDIADQSEAIDRAIFAGIETMPYLAEIYPVGGAADRLQLREEKTGARLPAARLQFLETNLLERLIRDLLAREYLYYKLFGKQLVTPITLMTSKDKDCDHHIRRICESNQWFGRPKESFRFICQPLVPTFDEEGRWCLESPLVLKLKPGGHGVIWKLARQERIFDWLAKQGRKKAIVRQINNPMAGTDYGLIAFSGIGFEKDYVFGFASCPRQIQSNEGMNVIRQVKTKEGYQVALTNVEYCEFAKHGIEDRPKEEGSSFSQFPSNTNILFADLNALQSASEELPFPGLILNFKQDLIWSNGEAKIAKVARLETTMQNIADAFQTAFSAPYGVEQIEELPTYLTFNHRRKTISVTKKEYQKGQSLLETPLGCLYDFVLNHTQLLRDLCDVKVPPNQSERDFIEQGPAFLFNFHPALGPLWSLIAQKIQRGEIAFGSELQLEIADIELKDFYLEGSLLVLTQAVVGHFDTVDRLIFSPRTGRCTMRNVRVINQGLDLSQKGAILQNNVVRQESVTIYLNENSHFIAEDVTFKGHYFIEVRPHCCLRAKQMGEIVTFIEEPLEQEEFYSYHAGDDKKIQLHSHGAELKHYPEKEKR